MKKLLLILLCVPLIGFGQILEVISTTGDIINGWGKKFWSDGSWEEGEYINGERVFGLDVERDGGIMKGYMMNNRFHGLAYAVYTDIDGSEWNNAGAYEFGALVIETAFIAIDGDVIQNNAELSFEATKKKIDEMFDFRKNTYMVGINTNTIKIPIIKEGNMNFVIIDIGGRKYKFLFDTGASDIVIDGTIKDYLINMNYLKYSDFGEDKIYEIASGEKLKFQTATLSSITIAGNKFRNVQIAIGDNASLLLGMSFIDRFDWKINDDVLELRNK